MAKAKRGFTLTELLVVIAIIAILATLAGAGIMAAMNSARSTAIKVELDQIDAALKRYKDTYGSYPPANLAFNESGLSGPARQARLGALRQHLSQAFPRYAADEPRLTRDLTEAGIDLQNFRPDQALVFWLQGFSSDPTAPILSVDSRPIHPTTGFVDRSATGPRPQKRTNNFFEFEPERLAGVVSGTVTNPAPSYFQANARISVNNGVAGKHYPEYSSGMPPIVYFDSRDYGTAPVVGTSEAQPVTFNSAATPLFADAGYAFPYWNDRNGNGRTNLADDENSQESWANPDTCQLIAPGLDGKYFVVNPLPPLPINAHLYPTGTNMEVITEGDNAANFTASSRIGDDLP